MIESKKNRPIQLEKTPANLKSLILDLCSDDGIRREKSRHSLVQMGDNAIDYLAGFITSSDSLLRWEVTKTLAEIATPSAAPVLVEAMEDELTSIRWIAGKGLIKMGKQGVIAALEALIENPDSSFLMESVHHVLHDLQDKLPARKLIQELMHVLENKQIDGRVSVMSVDLRNELKDSKAQ
jgi:HEAT repeat protein